MAATGTAMPVNNVVPLPVQAVPQAQQVTFVRGDEVELADKAKKYLETSELTYDEGRFWRYDPQVGIYRELSNEVVNCAIGGFAGAPVATARGAQALNVSSRQINGARSILRDRLLADTSRGLFADAAKGLVFKNGFVCVVNGQVVLDVHSPGHLARYAYPFDYKAGSLPPKFQVFLHTIFRDVSYEERQDRISLLQEFVGTTLVGDATKYEKALVFAGEGGNGKSHVLRIARAAFPTDSVVTVPPQFWSERFHVASLAGALANFVDEIPERDITGGEVFKAVITGENVHAERKHQAPFDYNPIAGHIFSANTLPGTVDQSAAYWRRFLLLPFTRDMKNAPEHRVDASREIIDTELPAVVAWFLAGAARVQQQGRYTVPASSAALLETWRKDADPVLKFADEECTPDPQGTTKPQKLFDCYCGWAKANNFSPMSSVKFYRRFSKAAIGKAHTSKGNVYLCSVPRAFALTGRST